MWVVVIVEPFSVSFPLKSASCVSTQLVREGGGGELCSVVVVLW